MLDKIIFPSKKDPRLVIIIFLLMYVLYALTSPSFTRNPWQFIAGFLTCLTVDILFLKFYKKTPLFPLSGLITSLGIFLLVNSPLIWPYILVAALSIASKHLLTSNNSHIFNPNNFGLVICLLFVDHNISVEMANWGGNLWLVCFIFAFGCFIVYHARRHFLVFSFFSAFIALAIFRSYLSGLPLITILTPITGAAFHLFIFYMISDPKTTPLSPRRQVVFGLVLALTDTIFRIYQQKYAPFYSLFLITALYSSYVSFSRQIESSQRSHAKI